MKTKIFKILSVVFIVLLVFLKCSDNNIINIYNKYTENYRNTPEDHLDSPDTCITVKVLSSHTGLPLKKIKIVLTAPSNDTLSMETDNDGFAIFIFPVVIEGSYSVKAAYYKNGIEYSQGNNYRLSKKNNPPLTIHINENPWY